MGVTATSRERSSPSTAIAPAPLPAGLPRAPPEARSELRAEVGRIRRAWHAAILRSASHDADADLAEGAAQDVGAVWRAVHPRVHRAGRGRVALRTPVDVLADRPGPTSAQIARPPDAVHERVSGRSRVGEVAPPDHVARVRGCRVRKA